MMIKRLIVLVLAVALLVPVSSLAGMYVGAGVGNTWQSSDVTVDEVTKEVKEISENSTGWKLFAGFTGDSIFGVEGGYRELGTIESKVLDINYSSKTTGWDVAAMGHLALGPIDLFAKAGAFFWDTDFSADNTGENDSGTAFLWGLGAGLSLGPIGVRLEWESMEVDQPDNLSMLTLGATFGF